MHIASPCSIWVMKHFIINLVFVFLLAGCDSFSSSPVSKSASRQEDFTAMVWNVQSLFDSEEAGNEYADFLEASGWTMEKYQARLTAISQAVLDITPDIAGFVEIENANVLEDLGKSSFLKNGYKWSAFSNLPGSPLGIGVLSRFPLTDIRTHSITIGNDTAPRPILEVRIEPQEKPLVFFVCHWKSKLGNDTVALRRAAARVIQRRLAELRESEANTPAIIMGDLNENHDEFYLNGRTYISALLPDDPHAAELAAGTRDFLVLSREKPPRASCFPQDVQALYSPWGAEMTNGSYFYRGNWETIDHFLLSGGLFSGSGWRFSGCHVLNDEPFTTAKGVPNAYAARSGRGLSDHLPLLLHLRLSEL